MKTNEEDHHSEGEGIFGEKLSTVMFGKIKEQVPFYETVSSEKMTNGRNRVGYRDEILELELTSLLA